MRKPEGRPYHLVNGAYEAAEEVGLRCHPERSEGPQHLGFQATTGVLRRLRLLRMTGWDFFPQPLVPSRGPLAS